MFVGTSDRDRRKRALNEYVQRVIVDWLAEKPGRTNVELAGLVGLTDAQIAIIKKHARNVGDETARGFAKLLGISKDELEARAEAAYTEREPPGELTREYTERYANRTLALEMAGEIHPDARAKALSWAFNSETDPPVSMWLDRIRVADAETRWELAHPVEAKARKAAKHATDDATKAGDAKAYADEIKDIAARTGQRTTAARPPPPKQTKKPGGK